MIEIKFKDFGQDLEQYKCGCQRYYLIGNPLIKSLQYYRLIDEERREML